MSLIYSPGPAAYDIGSGIGKAPAATLKGRYKPSDANAVPGAGSYNIASTIGNAPAYTLRPRTGTKEDVHSVPGPGAYNHDTDKGKGPKITMAPKLDLKGLTDAVPGPGSYQNPYEVGKEAPKYSMTGRGNSSNDGIKSPGPGAYNVDAGTKPKFAASMKSRHYDKPDAFAPGPGAYKLGDTIGGAGNSPAYTMRPKPSPKNTGGSEFVPGPGAYSIPTTIGTSPAKSMTSRRPQPGDAALASQPGPGAYKLADSIGAGHAPSYTLRPKTNVPVDLADSPGPGAYNHDTDKGKGPKITMAPKLDLKGLTDAVPGPGSYQNPYEVGKEAPKCSMTGRGNSSNDGIKSPGPGAYNVDAGTKPKFAASMKSRHYDKPDAFAPGPGAYRPESTFVIGSNAPKISMHKKLGDYTYASSTNPPFLAQR